jgi:enterochelin esterase family protein
MKKIISILVTTMFCGIASAQFAGIHQCQQEEPLPPGLKPASTDTFLSQYPAVNAQTRQDMFRVIAPSAQTVQIDLANN